MTVVSTCPAKVMVMTPPHMQLQIDVSFSAGIPAIVVMAEPGVQGDTVMGMHGTGVGVPSAAAVAAMNIGFPGQMHMPNGAMFMIGAKSMIFAASGPEHVTIFGMAVNDDGAAPNGHARIAPVTT